MAIIATSGFLILLLSGFFCIDAAVQPQLMTGTAWTKTYPDCDSCEPHAITRTADGGTLSPVQAEVTRTGA